MELCKSLNETPIQELPAALKSLVDIDELLWFLAVDIATVNSDGYWMRGSDYYIWLDDQGKFHFYPYDMNEAFLAGHGPGGVGRKGRGGPPEFGPPGFGPPGFGPPGFGGRGGRGGRGGPGGGGPDLDPLAGLDNVRFPLRSRVLAVPEYRQQYLQNIERLGRQTMNWQQLAPVVASYRALIAQELKEDTRKLSDYEQFLEATSPDSEGLLRKFFEARSQRLLKSN
jgi:spore coat protein CotH